MSNVARQTYIISDLHLGGIYPPAGSTNDRGFRICTHAPELTAFLEILAAKPVDAPPIELIINGDLVDFLAERDTDGQTWSAFTHDETKATAKFEAIVQRDAGVFNALANFIAAGHRLVILLGNHDIELSMPAVRAALAKALGVTRGSDYELIRDGEAYRVGDALIEHGNRYDSFNIVDYGGLQTHSQYVSRGESHGDPTFAAPPGSVLVAEVINPIKVQYKFVDLLKPESGAVVPLLLALEPGYRSVLGKVALIVAKARAAVRVQPTVTFRGGLEDDPMAVQEIAPAAVMSEAAALEALLVEKMKGAEHDLKAVIDEAERDVIVAAGERGFDISKEVNAVAGFIDRSFGIAELLLASATSKRETRLNALLAAFRSLQNDKSFDVGVETEVEYLDAASALASNGIRHVIFGHTHMAKKIGLPSGGYYLNSGTWADVMQFPSRILVGEKEEVREHVSAFVGEIVSGDFSKFALFRPTYVRLDVDASGVVTPELCTYSPTTPV